LCRYKRFNVFSDNRTLGTKTRGDRYIEMRCLACEMAPTAVRKLHCCKRTAVTVAVKVGSTLCIEDSPALHFLLRSPPCPCVARHFRFAFSL